MPRPASSIISRALQIAKLGNVVNGTVVGYKPQALDELNSILDTICQTIDFSAARGVFNFNFATNLVSSGAGNIIQAAPNPLPLDYLRVPVSTGSSGAQRSSKWYIQGVPWDMVEVDLTEWDDQVQQAGQQSYPYLWAKDMSTRAIIFNVTGNVTPGSATVTNIANTAGIGAGMSIAGGIGALSIIVPGTTIIGVGPSSLTLSQPAASPGGVGTGTLVGASLMVGFPPVGYPYPAPSGAFPVMIRYQRMMPPLTQAQVDGGVYCWFDDDEVLEKYLASAMMRYSDDTRQEKFWADGTNALGRYTRLADDNANRAATVSLDRRRFGKSFSDLKNTKTTGW